jgi:hypothetical protein
MLESHAKPESHRAATSSDYPMESVVSGTRLEATAFTFTGGNFDYFLAADNIDPCSTYLWKVQTGRKVMELDIYGRVIGQVDRGDLQECYSDMNIAHSRNTQAS